MEGDPYEIEFETDGYTVESLTVEGNGRGFTIKVKDPNGEFHTKHLAPGELIKIAKEAPYLGSFDFKQ